MAKALQECPGSGVLWAEEILVAQRAEQKSELLDVVAAVCCLQPWAVDSVVVLRCGLGCDICGF